MTKRTRAKRNTARQSMHDEVTTRIVEALEAGVVPWVKPWTAGSGMDVNAVSKKPYRGINVMLLWITAMDRGYCATRWLTFNQAKQAGGTVRKGEKGTRIVFWKPIEKTDPDSGEKKGFAMVRAYTVFNVEQCDGLPDRMFDVGVPVAQHERDAACEAFIAATGARFSEGGTRAFYKPSTDECRMPPLGTFETSSHYYGTAFHELTHWSGAKHRLDRDLSGRFGGEAYAAEELVAELGAAFLCAELDVPGQLRHADYIGHWIKVLTDDNKAIFTASSLARKAADYLIDCGAGENEAAA